MTVRLVPTQIMKCYILLQLCSSVQQLRFIYLDSTLSKAFHNEDKANLTVAKSLCGIIETKIDSLGQVRYKSDR